MTSKDIFQYAQNNWNRHKKTITVISETGKMDNQGNPISLVKSDLMIYCFDDISENIYQDKRKDKTASVDGMIITNKVVYLVEFKSGFKRKITKENFDKTKMTCDQTKEFCEEYANLFLKNSNKEIVELKTNIQLKTIESYWTFEKEIFPFCQELQPTKSNYRIEMIVVIDGNSDDAMLAALAELSKGTKTDKIFSDINKSLKKYKKTKDGNGNDYYYDEIKVMSTYEFEAFIKQINISA